MQRGLLLDHLTVVDAAPLELADVAQASGYTGLCLFMESMPVLERMPSFNLITNRPARRDLLRRLETLGLSLELAYPFTQTGRSATEDFRPALECAADLGAQRVNLLVYDREPSRRADNFAAFCVSAQQFGLAVAVEFFPASQVRTLADALALVSPEGTAPLAAVNVDLLHLMRSGGCIADLAAAAPLIGFGQIADGPLWIAAEEMSHEASAQRALAGTGQFDVAGFIAALPDQCPISIEIPQENAILSGLGIAERAQRAVDSVNRIVGCA